MWSRIRSAAFRERTYFGTGVSVVLHEKVYFASFVLLSFPITLAYVALFPSLPLGSINLQVIRFITPLQVAFSIVFGVLFSLVITLNVFSIRSNLRGTASLALGSLFASLVNGLCCTPLVPSLLALISTTPTFLFAHSPATQAFFEANYPYFYVLSAAILLLSVQRLAKNISCCRVPLK